MSSWNNKTLAMVGKRFGRLLALAVDEDPRRLLVSCDCGKEKSVQSKYLRNGRTTSCGCYARESTRLRETTHAMTGTRIHRIWANMLTRCRNPKCHRYDRYGGRGISVCRRWLSFAAFYEDVGDPPSSKHQLDRFPDKDGDYAPSNVRWATSKEQQRNKANNRILSYLGENLTVAEWAERLRIPVATILSRIDKLGWSEEKAVGTPRTGRGFNGRN